MKAQTKELAILTEKEYSVSATKFFSKNDNGHTIIISSATGVLQKYYAKFASFFAIQGFTVYTFDYKGIGKSITSTKELKSYLGNLKSWGRNDQSAIVAFAAKENSEAKITLITHSIGGQLLGFNTNNHLIDQAVLVASQSGYWKYFNGIHLLKMWLFWYILIPFLTPIFGYFPSKKMGLFENLPKNMAYEWAEWGKKKEYMMHFHNAEDYFFDALKIPILSLSFSRDSFAPKKTVDWLTSQYKNAQIKRVHHIPENGENHVKHFGFFRPSFKDTLWQQTLQWVLNDKTK